MNMEKCKHELNKEQCAWCNGTMAKKEVEQQKYKDERIARREYNIKRSKLQEMSEETATDTGLHLTDKHLKYVLTNISGVEYNDIDTLYDIAIKTKRTLGAIEFVWRFAFGENSKLNAPRNGEERKLYLRIQKLKIELGI